MSVRELCHPHHQQVSRLPFFVTTNHTLHIDPRGARRRIPTVKSPLRPTSHSYHLQRYIHTAFAVPSSSTFSLATPSCEQNQTPPVSSDTDTEPGTVSALPPAVVQRIASGEVAHDIGDVLLELIENAIDARASCINIDIDTRTRSVTVHDDGDGISASSPDVLLQLGKQPHMTSKVRSVAHLGRVDTLGFRGQALWAIAGVCENGLYVASRTKSATIGYANKNTNSIFSTRRINAVPMSPGTLVIASGLTTATQTRVQVRSRSKTRTQPQSQTKQWIRKAKRIVLNTALVHPALALRLSRNGKPIWNRSHGTTPAATLARELRIDGSSVVTTAQTLPCCESISISATLAVNSLETTGPNNLFLTSVNGRVVRLESLIRTVAKRIIASSSSSSSSVGTAGSIRLPTAVISLTVPPDLITWNVQPDKSQFRIIHPDTNFEAMLAEDVAAVIASLLQPFLSWAGVGLMAGAGSSNAKNGPITHMLASVREEQQAALRASENEKQDRDILKTNSPDNRDEGLPSSEGDDATTVAGLLLGNVRVVAQVLSTYILVEHAGGIVLIEQHVADERAIYEELCAQWREGRRHMVALGKPIRLAVQDECAAFRLSGLGFDVDIDDGLNDDEEESSYDDSGARLSTTAGSRDTVVVKSVPRMLADSPASMTRQILQELTTQDGSVEQAAAGMSCRLAVRNGRALTVAQMRRVVGRLMRCDNGHTCPHGRPIFHQLGTADLARLFGRSWSPERMAKMGPGVDGGESRRRFMYGLIEE